MKNIRIYLFNTPEIRKHTCMKHFTSAVVNFKYPYMQHISYRICSTLGASTFFSSDLGATHEYLQSE